MAKSQQQRDAAAAEKRQKLGEVELRHRVRPGTVAMLEELMVWHGITERAEAVQLLIMNAHALGPTGSAPALSISRHEFQITESVAREFEQQSRREIQRDPGDEIVRPASNQ